NWKLARDGFTRLFPKNDSGFVDWQKVAAFAALRKNFCVISGGPGTGKTHTVAKILTLLIEQADSVKLRIKLAAPTGKAAARLQESLRNEKSKMDCDLFVRAQLPEEAGTIHRLLGSLPDSTTFRHDAENPLAADVVIVDEASMVGLPLMAKVVAAVPKTARLILLGDKDQLASVEAGAVLGEICNAGFAHDVSAAFADEYKAFTGETIASKHRAGNQALADCIVELQKNYRFAEKSGIHQLSQAVNQGDTAEAMNVLGKAGAGSGEIGWQVLPELARLKETLRPIVLKHFAPCFQSSDPETILRTLEKFRILCAVRKGHFGVETINRLVEEILREAGCIQTDSDWYAGRPVMITRNDYNVRLFNGDIGVALPDATGAMRVFFRTEDEGIRPVSTLRLPEHETVYAMTVHKSQGSEFGNVLLVLPERDSPVLTRELIYTGLTRASSGVQLWLREEIFKMAISRRVERTSGLRDALWNTRA
ncbi:MAG TPA: exodeoxyribonuclease V subunit alpha, partial [Verrucomicrobiae bacterium]|nr:exodeoxyribonuclease V subunit alpha [Verrucomicrobiae bacterium]